MTPCRTIGSLGLALVLGSSGVAGAQGTTTDTTPMREARDPAPVRPANRPDAPQDAPPTAPQDVRQKSPPGGILGGPEVVEDARGGSPFDRRGDRRPQEPPIPPERWLRMLFSLDLSEDQRTGLQALLNDFRDRQAAFRDQHGERLRQLDRQRREAERAQRPPDAEMIAELQRLMSAMPRLDSVQEPAWRLLTEEQQLRFKAVLAAETERILAERAARERGQRSAGQAMQDAPANRPGDMMMQPDPPMRGTMKPGEPLQTRSTTAARPGQDGADLDEPNQRRLRFLRSRQKSRQPGLPPGREDFEFDFQDGRGPEVAPAHA